MRDRYNKRCGLAGAGLGQTDDVAAFKRGTENFLLNRPGLVIAHRTKVADEQRVKLRLLEGHAGLKSAVCEDEEVDRPIR